MKTTLLLASLLLSLVACGDLEDLPEQANQPTAAIQTSGNSSTSNTNVVASIPRNSSSTASSGRPTTRPVTSVMATSTANETSSSTSTSTIVTNTQGTSTAPPAEMFTFTVEAGNFSWRRGLKPRVPGNFQPAGRRQMSHETELLMIKGDGPIQFDFEGLPFITYSKGYEDACFYNTLDFEITRIFQEPDPRVQAQLDAPYKLLIDPRNFEGETPINFRSEYHSNYNPPAYRRGLTPAQIQVCDQTWQPDRGQRVTVTHQWTLKSRPVKSIQMTRPDRCEAPSGSLIHLVSDLGPLKLNYEPLDPRRDSLAEAMNWRGSEKFYMFFDQSFLEHRYDARNDQPKQLTVNVGRGVGEGKIMPARGGVQERFKVWPMDQIDSVKLSLFVGDEALSYTKGVEIPGGNFKDVFVGIDQVQLKNGEVACNFEADLEITTTTPEVCSPIKQGRRRSYHPHSTYLGMDLDKPGRCDFSVKVLNTGETYSYSVNKLEG